MFTALNTIPSLTGKSREIRVLFADTANESLAQGRSESEAIFKALNIVKLKEQQSIKKFIPQVVPAHLAAILKVRSAANLAQEAQEQVEKEKATLSNQEQSNDVVGAVFDSQGRLVLKLKDGKTITSNVAPVTSVEHNVVVVSGDGTSTNPIGTNTDTAIITTSEILSAGDWVNVWDSAGAKVRKASASAQGKEAHGFVLSSFGVGVSATVYFEGSNTAVTGQTAGVVFLSVVDGLGTTTAPAAIGNVVQRIGFAVSTTSVNFDSQQPITLT